MYHASHEPRFYRVTLIGFLLFLSITLVSCKTVPTPPTGAENRQQEILNTQKSVIVSFLNKGLPEMAIKELRILISKYPDDGDFRNLMGLSLLAIQNPKAAIPHFKQAYRLTPRTAVALNLSSAYIEADQPQKAMEILKGLAEPGKLASYPHPERVDHNLALAAEKLNDHKAAENYYLKALGTNPSFYLSLMRLGQLYEKSGQSKKAFTYFEKAKKVCSKCFDPVNALASQLLKQGQAAKATRLLRSYLKQKEIAPQDRQHGKKLLGMTASARKQRR